MNSRHLALLSLLILPICGQGQTIYEDMEIRTWVHRINNWDMRSTQYKDVYLTSVPPFAMDRVAGVKVLILSDGTTPEVFNLTRQSGMTDFYRANRRSGGYARIVRNSPGYTFPLMFLLERGPCPRLGGDCVVGGGNGQGTDNFFLADFGVTRSFTSTSSNRAVVKVDYVCTGTCGSETVHTAWKKLGGWNMQSAKSKAISLINDGIANANIVDISTTIHSDANADGKIQVDDFEHVGLKGNITKSYPLARGRGGITWVGKGCGGRFFGVRGDCLEAINNLDEARMLRYYAGPKEREPGWPVSSYRNDNFYIETVDGRTPVPLTYTDMSRNRGWTKIQYTGTKSTVPVPYAMKSKAISIGPWNMGSELERYKKIPFSGLNVAANRITRITTAIMSDPGYDFDPNGRTIANFHRPPSSSGTFWGEDAGYAGGLTYIEEASNNIILTLQLRENQSNFFSSSGFTGGGNRGFVLMDYLAGSCEQGPTGFKIQAVPGTFIGDCSGTGSPFVLEGAGQDIFYANDEFAYAYKSGTGDRDLQIKVESQGNTSEWAKVGIMFRANLSASSKHASILLTPSHGAHFTWRPDGSTSTSRTPDNDAKAPYFLRITKVGNTFTAYRRHPAVSTWTRMGSQTITSIGANNTAYYYGIAQSSNSPALNQASFSGRNF